MNLSPCGINCDACPLKEKCGNGYQQSCGKPFYIENFGVERCPIYDCSVNKKGYTTCGECDELPCQLFYDWRDPSMTYEEHSVYVDGNVPDDVLRDMVDKSYTLILAGFSKKAQKEILEENR